MAIPPAFNRFPNSQPHIRRRLRGWLLQLQMGPVLSADAYSAFEESGVLDSATGKRFWTKSRRRRQPPGA